MRTKAKVAPKSRKNHLAAAWKVPLGKLWARYNCWELGLLTLGLLSFIGIVVILFTPIGKGPSLIVPQGPIPPVADPAFMKFASDWMTLPEDRAPAPLVLEDGDQIVPSLLRDIDSAQHSIEFMAYVWKDGKLSDVIFDHLLKRQRGGVQVRLLLDAYGALHAPHSRIQALRDAGGKVATFHALLPAPWTFMRATKRDHRRSIVIDGRVAYTGGLGVDDVWLGRAQPPQWHDLMFRVQAAMASRLQGSFAELWAATTGELLTDFRQPPSDEAGVPFLTLSAAPSPDLYGDETFLLISLLGARRSIHIETPYFLPNATIRKALIDKARSGVDVTILLPSANTDEKSVRWAGQRIYEELLKGGVKIYEYQNTFTHTKLMIEDGAWSVIGSANMDIRSRRLNDEIVIGLQDKSFAGNMEAIYRRDLEKSKTIKLDQWRQRGPVQRVLELVSQAFVQQY